MTRSHAEIDVIRSLQLISNGMFLMRRAARLAMKSRAKRRYLHWGPSIRRNVDDVFRVDVLVIHAALKHAWRRYCQCGPINMSNRILYALNKPRYCEGEAASRNIAWRRLALRDVTAIAAPPIHRKMDDTFASALKDSANLEEHRELR